MFVLLACNGLFVAPVAACQLRLLAGPSMSAHWAASPLACRHHLAGKPQKALRFARRNYVGYPGFDVSPVFVFCGTVVGDSTLGRESPRRLGPAAKLTKLCWTGRANNNNNNNHYHSRDIPYNTDKGIFSNVAFTPTSRGDFFWNLASSVLPKPRFPALCRVGQYILEWRTTKHTSRHKLIYCFLELVCTCLS